MGSATPSRLVGELLGTAALVFFASGALLITEDPFVGAIGLLVTATVVMWAFGALVNPWLTLASAVRGTLDWVGAVFIILAQLIGGALGGLLMWAIYGSVGTARGLGVTRLSEPATQGNGVLAAIVAETVAIFLLACVVFALSGEKNGGKSMLALGTGLAYAAGFFAIYSVTGASLNFARTLGPELSLAIAGGTTDWSHLWVFAVAGVIGSALAGLLYPLWRSDD